MSFNSKALFGLTGFIFLLSPSAFAANNVFYKENIAALLKSAKPAITENITFSDETDPFPDGVEFALPVRFLRAMPVVRVTRQDPSNQCKLVQQFRSRKTLYYRVLTNLSWDDEGCDIEFQVQTVNGPKRIAYTVQLIGS